MASFFWGALAFGDFAKTASDETLQTIMILELYAFNGIFLTFAVFALAATLVIVQTGVLPRWLAVPGVILGVLGTLSPLGILSASSESFFDIFWFASFPALPIWVLLVSVAMVMKEEEPVAATAEGAA